MFGAGPVSSFCEDPAAKSTTNGAPMSTHARTRWDDALASSLSPRDVWVEARRQGLPLDPCMWQHLPL
jgi:hypothetical protein